MSKIYIDERTLDILVNAVIKIEDDAIKTGERRTETIDKLKKKVMEVVKCSSNL